MIGLENGTHILVYSFLLLKLAYGLILDLNEMLQLATVCLSISFSIIPLTGSEEGVKMLTHAANCGMCLIGYLLAVLWKLNGPRMVEE